MRIPNALAVAGLIMSSWTPSPVSAQDSSDQGINLTVQNERNEQVTVFLERVTSGVSGNALNLRIGAVAPASTGTFTLPEWATDTPEGDLTFFLYPEGEAELEPVEFTRSTGNDLGIIVVEQDDLKETLAAPTVEPGEASVTVLNNRSTPVLVLIEEQTDRAMPIHIFIGTASPNTESTLPIPSDLVEAGNEIRFVFHPAGGEDLPTQVVTLDAESRVEVIVPE